MHRAATLPILLALTTTLAAQQSGAWWNWRGPNFNGAVSSGNPPQEWNEADGKNIKWKCELPGKGSSSPIIHGDTIYVTTAVQLDSNGKAIAEGGGNQSGGGQRGRRGDFGGQRRGRGGDRRRRGRGRGRSAPKNVHEFRVLAINRKTGAVEWSTPVHKEVPHTGTHSTGTQASNSPVTDGKFLYAHFGSHGIHCVDLAGKKKWSKQLGKMTTRNSFGEGSSPALHGDTLIVNWDHEKDSFIVALNKKTGDELWRKSRDEPTSWSTPLIVEVDGKPQVIVTATKATRAYDLESGDVIWTCSGMTLNVIPTPIYENGLLYLMSGFRGAALQALNIQGAKGDLTKSDRMVWSHDRYTAYTPSALSYRSNLYFLQTNSGVLSCLNAKKGDVHYERQRLGIRTVYSSPVGAAGRVYITGRQGTTKVVKAGDEFKVLATNKLEDTIDATAAVVGDEIYVRGWKKLYCIAESGEK